MTEPRLPLVLASASPRRRQLLETVGIEFEVHPSHIEEIPFDGELPNAFARRAAVDKAHDVAHRFADRAVLAADTVVEHRGKILGKPEGPEEAEAMLQRLSGEAHLVHTGVALVVGGRLLDLVDTAEVRFHRLDRERVARYVATGEPLDKAGAYALQGVGALFVAAVHGSPHTVIGLPLGRLPELFDGLGLSLWPLLDPPLG